ncbi:hypothetical protein [Nostoc sp. PCC 7107]|uniref:hypothetical protein n=1 Tax=Nostoc sp. PCC 7107 TaxID=317936 RepID=UPI00155A3F1C|nr:hypothetical protein [Nostoc sp. PCC 7107]
MPTDALSVGLCGALAATRPGVEPIAAVQEMAQGSAESVLECVGSESAMAIGYVGVLHGSGHNFNLGLLPPHTPRPTATHLRKVTLLKAIVSFFG